MPRGSEFRFASNARRYSPVAKSEFCGCRRGLCGRTGSLIQFFEDPLVPNPDNACLLRF
jgi:hypothetical protein